MGLIYNTYGETCDCGARLANAEGGGQLGREAGTGEGCRQLQREAGNCGKCDDETQFYP